MKPRPIYRWKSFWLGLLTVGFVAWAWWDSYRCEALLHVTTNEHAVQLARFHGVMMLASGPIPDMPYWGFWGFSHRPITRGVFGLGTVREEAWVNAWGKGVRYVKIPDSLAFLTIVGLWTGWLVWRARMEKKEAVSAGRV